MTALHRVMLGLTVCSILASCGPTTIFPANVLQGVDPNFDFSRWRMVPNQAEAKKIQLGGRIVQAESKGTTVTIAAAQLPIVEHPAYGPKDTGKRNGEFAINYIGTIDASYLQPGNRIMVVGTTQAPRVVTIDDLPKSLPTVQAACVHIWKTGGRDIADFPSYGAGYETLEEDTFCVDSRR